MTATVHRLEPARRAAGLPPVKVRAELTATPDERRPWTYPDPWSGVVWMPTPRRTRPALSWSVADLVGATSRLLACMLIAASLFMSAVTIAAVAVGGA
jgi:hypothetical protein